MPTLLTRTLECIAREADDFNESFSLVDQLIEQYGEKDLAERLYNDIDLATEWRVVADLFSILIWSTSDNGTALTNLTEQWIVQCEDERKISIALNIDVYPFRPPSKMEERLNKVGDKFPSLYSRCQKLIQSRKKDSKV